MAPAKPERAPRGPLRRAAALVVSLVALACARPPSADGVDTSETTSEDEAGELLVVDPDPPRDASLSPYTGWTRAHHLALFARTLNGFVNHLSDGGARTTYSGSPLDTPGAVEGVTRMLMAMGAWLANPDNPRRLEYRGRELDVVEIARTALIHGTDPAHADYWLPIEAGDQRVIEAGFVAQFLLDARARVWDTLSADEQDQIMAWLTPADEGYLNNWATAELHRNLARKLLGYPVDPSALAGQLRFVDGLYVGDGWYEDGAGDHYDYYNAFILHHDLLTWARHDGDSDPALRDEIRARAAAFVHHFPYMFDAGGAQVFFGRSLAYRSAVTAALQAAEIDGASPLAPGTARRLVSANLAFFVGDELLGTEWMFDADDGIRSGYLSAEPGVLESYQREGSQNFHARAFTGLRLSEDHPYWSATEQPIPADEGAFVHTMSAPGFALAHDPGQGHVVLLNTRSDTTNLGYVDLYRRVQYSSRFYFQRGFSPPFPYDGALTTSRTEAMRSHRGSLLDGAVGRGVAYARYQLIPEVFLFDGLHQLAVTSLWTHGGLVQIACVEPRWEEATRIYAGAFALPAPAFVDELAWAGPAMIARADGATTLLAGLFGYAEVGLDLGVAGSDRYNAIHPQASFLGLRGQQLSQAPICAGSFSLATLGELDPGPVEALVAAAAASVEGDDATRQWTLTLDDGARVFVDLRPVPIRKRRELGPLIFEGPLRAVMVSADGSRWASLGASEVRRASDDAALVELASLSGDLHDLALAWTAEADGSLTLELGAPAIVTLPAPWIDATVEIVGLGGASTDTGDGPVAGVYDVDGSRFAAAASDLRLRTATLRFR